MVVDDGSHWLITFHYHDPDTWFPLIHQLEHGLSAQGFKDALRNYRVGNRWMIPKERLSVEKLLAAIRITLPQLKDIGGEIILGKSLDDRRRIIEAEAEITDLDKELVAVVSRKPAMVEPELEPEPEPADDEDEGPEDARRRWSEEMNAEFIHLFDIGFADADIAAKLKRTVKAVISHRARLGLKMADRGRKAASFLTEVMNRLDDLEDRVCTLEGD